MLEYPTRFSLALLPFVRGRRKVSLHVPHLPICRISVFPWCRNSTNSSSSVGMAKQFRNGSLMSGGLKGKRILKESEANRIRTPHPIALPPEFRLTSLRFNSALDRPPFHALRLLIHNNIPPTPSCSSSCQLTTPRHHFVFFVCVVSSVSQAPRYWE